MKSNPTRQKILAAAQRLMMRLGFHAVTIDQIIAEAGISKGSFFYHFKSKDELPAALLNTFLTCQGDSFLQVIEEAEAQHPDEPLAKALAIVRGVGEIFAHTGLGEPGCVMAAFSYQMREDSTVQALSQEAIAGWTGAFSGIFQALCEARPQAPAAAVLARQFLCSLQGATVVARIEGSGQAVHEVTEVFCQLLQNFFGESSAT